MFQSCHLLLLVMNILQNSSENKELKKGIWDIKMYYELAFRRKAHFRRKKRLGRFQHAFTFNRPPAVHNLCLVNNANYIRVYQFTALKF